VITTKDITTDRITTNGTLPRRSICLKLGYLKLDTISRPASAVNSAVKPDTNIEGSAEWADHTKPAIRAAAAGLGRPINSLLLLRVD
jgi:hypothetical protein